MAKVIISISGGIYHEAKKAMPDVLGRAKIMKTPTTNTAALDESVVDAVRHRVGCHDGLDVTPAQVRSVLKHWRIETATLTQQQAAPL